METRSNLQDRVMSTCFDASNDGESEYHIPPRLQSHHIIEKESEIVCIAGLHTHTQYARIGTQIFHIQPLIPDTTERSRVEADAENI